jgi:hypothetical protein
MVRPEQLVGRLLLLVAQRGVERPEGGEEGAVRLDTRLAQADARLDLAEQIRRRAVAARLAERADRRIHLGGAVAQRRRHGLPQRRLGVGDLELGAQEGEAPLDMAPGQRVLRPQLRAVGGDLRHAASGEKRRANEGGGHQCESGRDTEN